jgi:DNA-binding MarR family transcriptional regulator
MVERDDLGALFARITRRIIDAERPLLAAHGLSMWAYIALSRLAKSPAQTQLALAKSIGHDKTRLIALLDDLEADGLLTREPDPVDRRARIIAITPAGRNRLSAAGADIRAMEADLLRGLTSVERRSLRSLLPRLAASEPE